ACFPVSSPRSHSASTACSFMPVMVDFMLVQARCIDPLTEPPCAGCPPRPRTLASSSAAPSAQRRAAASNSVLRFGLVTPWAHVRKPCSPSLLVSIKSFIVLITSLVFIVITSFLGFCVSRPEGRFPTSLLQNYRR